MYTNFYAERAAKNIPWLSIFEEEAIRKSQEFRKKVINAFERVNGPGSELNIQIEGGILLLSWLRTTEKILSLNYEVFSDAKSQVIKICKSIIESAENQDLDLTNINSNEYITLISGIMKKIGSPIKFVKKTYDDKHSLFGCRINASGTQTPIILISKQDSEFGACPLGILVSLYSAETNMNNIPNVIVVSNYHYISDSNSFQREYIRMGFKSPSDLSDMIQWLK